MSRFPIALGIVLVAAGLLWPVLQKMGLGRLPGDIVIEREIFRLYVPPGVSPAIGPVPTAVLWPIDR